MKLIEDLGMQYPTENSKEKKRFGLYECPICTEIFRCSVANVKSGETTKCRNCANRIATHIAGRASAALKILEAAKNFKRDAMIIHGDRYNYDLVDYVGAHTEVKIICNTHGVFLQTPHSHKNGRGCRS